MVGYPSIILRRVGIHQRIRISAYQNQTRKK